MTQGLDFCTFENRPSDFVALKLLALSLERHAPGARLHVFAAALPEELKAWLSARPNVIRHDAPRPTGAEFDIKAELLLWLLDHGVERPIWIDTDIILANAPPPVLAEAPPEALVVAEEPLMVEQRGIRMRAADIGFALRTDDLNVDVNTCVLRVSEAHRPLLLEWQRILLSPAYLDLKGLESFYRPFAFQTDQTVLGALLGSRRFQDVPIALLRESRDIAQCLRKTGYRPGPRLANALRGTPPFVHALFVPKPWRDTGDLFTWESLSPYRLVALRHEAELAPEERGWLWRETPKARLLRRLFRGNPELCGLPLALRERLVRERERVISAPVATARALMEKHGVPLGA